MRFDLARSRIMDINIKKFRSDFFANSGFPVDEEGMMLVKDIRKLIS